MSCFSTIHGNLLNAIRSVAPYARSRKRCLPLFLCIMFLTTAQSLHAEPSPPDIASIDIGESGDRLRIKRNPRLMETVYSLEGGHCNIHWTVYDSEANFGVIKHKSECDHAMQMQIPTIAVLLEEILKLDPISHSLQTLFWGRLLTTPSQKSCEMSFRLTMAAYKSMAWDKKRGKPRQGALSDFVKDTANNMMIYRELATLFQSHGLYLSLSSAEKILVTEAENLPYYKQLKKHGIMPKDRLPYDAMVWFSISRWERSELDTPPHNTTDTNQGS